MSDDKIKLVLCWHMHQPYYKNVSTGQYQLPWTYLHAIKDYVDMASHLEDCHNASAVVNFAPVLLEQLDEYAQQLAGFLADKNPLNDPLLNALTWKESDAAFSTKEKKDLLLACLRSNEERLINRFPHYQKLAGLAKTYLEDDSLLAYVSSQFISDLLVWYHLAWMGETVRRQNDVVQRLMSQEVHYSYDDRLALINVMSDVVSSIIPRFKSLYESGRVELAFSPYMHPIGPLLIDFETARESAPESELPATPCYPGGHERMQWHLEEGVRVFERYFGKKPSGCWPSEGGVSNAFISLCHSQGIGWIATGESVLRNSISHEENGRPDSLHRAYTLEGSSVNCFFRDDGLSDQIGFNYSKWHADDAVNDLIHHISNIADACGDKKNTVVSIILDGENAWEYYPENAYYFLSTLYHSLSNHSRFKLTTYEQCLNAINPSQLKNIVAGSWVYGTFSTWMGDAEKNKAWDLLCDAKLKYDFVVQQNRLTPDQQEAAMRQLAICEGSDWFWWFGDINPSESVKDFDLLFREHLMNLYQLLDEPVPENLHDVISAGGGSPELGGVMRHGKEA